MMRQGRGAMSEKMSRSGGRLPRKCVSSMLPPGWAAAQAAMRSSSALTRSVIAPPPELPVMPTRAWSTSGRDRR